MRIASSRMTISHVWREFQVQFIVFTCKTNHVWQELARPDESNSERISSHLGEISAGA